MHLFWGTCHGYGCNYTNLVCELWQPIHVNQHLSWNVTKFPKTWKYILRPVKKKASSEIFYSSCFKKLLIMGISLVWAIAVNLTQSVKFYNSIFSDSSQSSAGEILHSIKWFMKSENCLTTEYILPGVSCGYLKWDFRKLCQHLFNLSSCETSSISHNPLSSYYCCWISSCRLCC